MASRMSDTWYRRQARALYQIDGGVEVDDAARISRNDDVSDHGAYVQAWLWVPDRRTPSP